MMIHHKCSQENVCHLQIPAISAILAETTIHPPFFPGLPVKNALVTTIAPRSPSVTSTAETPFDTSDLAARSASSLRVYGCSRVNPQLMDENCFRMGE
jgi:hypothetical protein